jgi:hypothetical protein
MKIVFEENNPRPLVGGHFNQITPQAQQLLHDTQAQREPAQQESPLFRDSRRRLLYSREPITLSHLRFLCFFDSESAHYISLQILIVLPD